LASKFKKKSLPLIIPLLANYYRGLSQPTSFSLWNCQCEFGKKESVWLYVWVITVCIKILEFFVKQITYTDRDEAIPLGQTIVDCGIEQPEVIFTVFKGPEIVVLSLKTALLIYIGPL
jgi:hypothetical protein